MNVHRFCAALLVMTQIGCAARRSDAGARAAMATLRSVTGASIGIVRFEPTAGGVRVTGQLTGLPPGAHGMHLHAVGLCEAPAFTSAGGHFNPRNTRHGLVNPEGPHAGDLPAIAADGHGAARVEHTTSLVTLSDGAHSVFDADGTAVVVHAAGDDQRTDPSGNSGARIACGVIER